MGASMDRDSYWLLGILGLIVLTLAWFSIRPGQVARRCERVSAEYAGDALTPGNADPWVRPSDADWYAEHCYEGKPR